MASRWFRDLSWYVVFSFFVVLRLYGQTPELVNQGGASMADVYGSKLVFDPAGHWIAAASETGSLHIFDTESQRLARTIEVRMNITSLAADPAGKMIVVLNGGENLRSPRPGADRQSVVTSFDPTTGKQLWSTPLPYGCPEMAFRSGGSELVVFCYSFTTKRFSVSYNSMVQYLSVQTGIVQTHNDAEGTGIVPSALSERGGLAAGMVRSGAGSTTINFKAMAKEVARKQKAAKDNPAGSMQSSMDWMTTEIVDTTSWKSVAVVRGTVRAISEQARTAVVISGAGFALVNLDTRQATALAAQFGWGDPDSYLSVEISADGRHYLLAGLRRLTVVNSATGEIEQNLSADLPYTSEWSLSPDGTQAAAAQGPSVFLYALNNGSRRVLGDPSTVPLTGSTILSGAQKFSDSQSVTEKAQERQSQEQMYAAALPKLHRREKKEIQKTLGELQKEDKDQQGEVAKAEVATKENQDRMMNYIGTFGAVTAFPPVAALLESGRLLAVRAADGSWVAWDTATGNPLPFHRPPTSLSAYEHSGSRPEDFLRMDELHEVEQDLGVPPEHSVSSRSSVLKPAGNIVCASNNNQHWIELVRERKKVRKALLHHFDGRTIDLLALKLDLSALNDRSLMESAMDQTESFEQRDSDINQNFCSLSPDGNRLIVEEIRPETKDSRKAKIHALNAGFMAGGIYGRLFSDSLILYDTTNGRRICELDKPDRNAVFDLSAGEIVFSADGKRLAAGGARIPVGKTEEQRKLHVWDGETCKEIASSDSQTANPIGFSADNKLLYTRMVAMVEGGQSSGVHIFDAATLKQMFDLPDAYAGAGLLVELPDGNVLIGPDIGGSLGFWNLRNGERFGELRALQQGEWLVTTPAGLFDGSPRGWQQIAWRESDGLRTQPVEIFFNEFFRPGLLADLLSGNAPAPPRSLGQIDRKQPVVRLTADSLSSSARTVGLHIGLEEAAGDAGGSVRDLRVFRNGTLVRTWRGALPLVSGKTAIQAEFPIVAGENRFTAYAFNRDNVKSQDAEIVVQGTAPARQKTVYILAIGVNQYANNEFNLRYAVPDATRLASALAESQQKIDSNSHVVVVRLLDGDATKANILLALQRLLKAAPLPKSAPRSLGDLLPVQPEDSVIVYFAGHGIASDEHFYLIPHDLGYMGPRSDVSSALGSVLLHGISEVDLETVLEPLDAAHIELIVDACNSGRALDTAELRRGPLNNRGLAQLAYEKGMDVLTAAQSFQAALESSRLGHGYLTFALVEEGLTKADTTPVDGKITVPEWFEFASRRVPALQIEALKNATQDGRQLSFEIASPNASHPSESSLQTPRYYYRRAALGAEAVVAITQTNQR